MIVCLYCLEPRRLNTPQLVQRGTPITQILKTPKCRGASAGGYLFLHQVRREKRESIGISGRNLEPRFCLYAILHHNVAP